MGLLSNGLVDQSCAISDRAILVSEMVERGYHSPIVGVVGWVHASQEKNMGHTLNTVYNSSWTGIVIVSTFKLQIHASPHLWSLTLRLLLSASLRSSSISCADSTCVPSHLGSRFATRHYPTQPPHKDTDLLIAYFCYFLVSHFPLFRPDALHLHST